MKKTFKVQFPIAQAYIQTPMSYGTVQEPMMDFAGQEVTITVETAEKEKSKVQMCGSYLDDDPGKDCDKPARWKIDGSDIGRLFYSCDEHVHRALSYVARTYTISPIPPQPEPVVVEEDWDCQGSYTIPVPDKLKGKHLKVHARFEEVL